jgi:transcriptional regulator with XRE-family HTH domain
VASFSTREYELLIDVLRQAREDAGIRHDELAARLGHSRTWVYNLEHMGRRVDPVEVRAIARALGVDPLEVFARWLQRVVDEPGKSNAKSES